MHETHLRRREQLQANVALTTALLYLSTQAIQPMLGFCDQSNCTATLLCTLQRQQQAKSQHFAVLAAQSNGSNGASRSSPYVSNPYADELKETAKFISNRGRGILASDESNVTTGKRLASVGKPLRMYRSGRSSLRTWSLPKIYFKHAWIPRVQTGSPRGFFPPAQGLV